MTPFPSATHSPTINIIGCGKVGKTLGHLWQQAGIFRLGGILNRTPASSAEAVTFMQAGQAVTDMAELPAAEVFLLGCADNHLAACCTELVASRVLQAGNSVFHCSGALSSALLEPARAIGAHIASIHPVKSFADPRQAVQDFAGTFCGMEGDTAALAVLETAFTRIGARCFPLNAEHKTLYHTASVIACNYLVALQEVSLQTFAQAGVERELAMQILQPIVAGTVSNIFRLDTAQALTGPIARGDHTVVAQQIAALEAWRGDHAALYRLLGQVAVELSRQQGHAQTGDLQTLQQLLAIEAFTKLTG
ncbi:MAG TPA: DUF2520 domain-containing protein [Candidatus Thiothrix moscowensis]|uniref:Rossmann-like and DUF2520 domain-containing protein n=1 Tax=unclassified Thiothrix TaxID=2636184 RepID=UPI0025E79104|nr:MULTISPECIES: Rossmann-like and DUF2520 domain-containing protein [unclassified Thiothrix]HRJ53903.1 DUF2520 domain-containing protein [Candidatus Thiothrix moscowensis]HRJ93985.1 DUF2520 domain-containing protein [Candidatus Thiothrix moscowensis]